MSKWKTSIRTLCHHRLPKGPYISPHQHQCRHSCNHQVSKTLTHTHQTSCLHSQHQLPPDAWATHANTTENTKTTCAETEAYIWCNGSANWLFHMIALMPPPFATFHSPAHQPFPNTMTMHTSSWYKLSTSAPPHPSTQFLHLKTTWSQHAYLHCNTLCSNHIQHLQPAFRHRILPYNNQTSRHSSHHTSLQ